MKWSENAWKQIEEYYQLILAMPFVKELAEGSLSKEKFQFYMAQDSLYLEHFGRALALIGARAYNIQDVLSFTRFAENAIVVENALHESYFKDFDVTEKGKMQPVCHHYVHFLKSTAALDAVEIAMAAVLPCFWIYQKVGDYIYDNKKTDKILTKNGLILTAVKSLHSLFNKLLRFVIEQPRQLLRKSESK